MDRVLRAFRWLPWGNPEKEDAAPRAMTVTEVHAHYAQFVFRTLQQLGARPEDLDDLRQEVFISVHRKLPAYDPNLPMQPWLYKFCRNIMGNYRKRAHRRYEVPTDEVPEPNPEGVQLDQEEQLIQAQRCRALDEVLDELDLDKRIVFVMFEIEQMPCKDIAGVLDIPEGTVFSRLHKSREAFAAAVGRRNARLSKGGRP